MLEFATIIACGGKSRRFGADKVLQTLDGVSLFDRAVDIATSYGGPVAIAIREGKPAFERQLPLLVDQETDLGPIAALASGFAFAQSRRCSHILLIACDQPFLPPKLPQRLAAKIGNAGVVLPVSAGHDQNMAALWRCDPDGLAAYLNDGRRSLWGFAQRVGIERLEWDGRKGDPFADIDTRADLAAAEAQIRADSANGLACSQSALMRSAAD